MSSSVVYVCGLAITLLTSVSVVVYVRSPLQRTLVQLCGNADRAGFWTAFCDVLLGAVPLLFALNVAPERVDSHAPVLGLADPFKWGLVGLVVALASMAMVIGQSIARKPAGTSDEQRGKPAA